MIEYFSNFKSAIEWPKDYSQRGEEIPTGELKPFRIALFKAIEAAAENVAMSGVTDSPIETFFGARFALRARSLCDALGWEFSVGTENADLVLHPQFPVGRFRYDFAVRTAGRVKPLILVECDGKDFHSSVEQQVNDALKDAAASNAGIRLIRFTGSEINRDPDACASLALAAVISAIIVRSTRTEIR
jgi:very-short-patch-repair endonuclease